MSDITPVEVAVLRYLDLLDSKGFTHHVRNSEIKSYIEHEVDVSSSIYTVMEGMFRRGWVEAYEDTEESGLFRISAKGQIQLQRASDQVPASSSPKAVVPAQVSPKDDPLVDANVRKLPSGSTYVVKGEVPEGFGQDGDLFLELAPKEHELSSDPEIAELEAKLIPASNREVTIYHNQSDAGAALADLERSIPALSKPNDPDSLQIAMNAKSGVQYVQNCKEKDVPVKIGIFRFLVVEPFKRALDSSLDDAWKVIIKGALLVLLGLILVGLGII